MRIIEKGCDPSITDEYESSSEEEFIDSEEEPEKDLSHIDESNILKPIDTSGKKPSK